MKRQIKLSQIYWRPYEDAVHKRLNIKISQDQFDALVSATYNLGRGGIDSVFVLINGGDFQEAAKHLLKYVNASGVEVPALIERRKREAQMIHSEEKDDSAKDPIHLYTSGEPRLDYDRTYWLIPPGATEEEARQVFEMALPSRGTVGFSADDAGIGALPNRRVILFDEDRWGGDMNQWYAQYYPGVTIENRKLLDPLKKVSPKPIAYVPSGKNEPALVGLHGSADSSWGNPIVTSRARYDKKCKNRGIQASF